MFDTFDFMGFNWCCILRGPYYPTLPYMKIVSVLVIVKKRFMSMYE